MKFNLTHFLVFIAITAMHSIFAQTSIQQLGLDIDGEAADDRSGNAVSNSTDGLTVAIGAYLNNGNGSDAGHVRVYAWNGSAWIQKGLDINGEAFDDWSGWSVCISGNGNRIAIGAPNNDGNGTNSGHVRVYSWNGSAWTQTGVDLNGEAAADNFGSSVSLSEDGMTLAIGATSNDGNGSNSGHARVFSWNGTSWVQKGIDLNGEAAGDQFGGSLSLSADGNRLAVGATENDGNGASSGHTRVFNWNGSSWVQMGGDIDGAAASDYSGKSVMLNSLGNRVVIGSPFNSALFGQVRVFDWNGSSWIQVGSSIVGQSTNEQFGNAVSISDDGLRILGGAFGNANAGPAAGTARLYEWDGVSAWQQIDNDINGENSNDQSGIAVSLSGNGEILAIGAYLNDANGNSAGHVRCWKVCEAVLATDTQIACNSYLWINGVTYTTNNNVATYSVPGGAVNGCDSIITLDLTIITLAMGTDVISSCTPITWLNGNTYSNSNNTATYAYIGGAANGCDSIVTLDFTLLPAASVIDQIASCTPITWLDGNTYSTSNNTATYSYIGGAANGCDSIVTLDFTLLPAASGIDQISSCTPITWLDGNTYSTSNNTATFTYIGGAANGCDSTVTLNLIITTLDNSITTSDLTISAVANNVNYQWLNCDNMALISGANSQSFQATMNGNYAVIVSANGCSDTSDCVSITNVGLNNLTNAQDIYFYPNPTADVIHFQLTNPANIIVTDLAGRIIYSDFMFEGYNSINLHKEPNGLYLIRIVFEHAELNKKVELNK